MTPAFVSVCTKRAMRPSPSDRAGARRLPAGGPTRQIAKNAYGAALPGPAPTSTTPYRITGDGAGLPPAGASRLPVSVAPAGCRSYPDRSLRGVTPR